VVGGATGLGSAEILASISASLLFCGRRGWLTEFGDVVLFEVASGVFMVPVFFKGLKAVGAVIGATGTLLTFGRN
jgi:hypothetical protein